MSLCACNAFVADYFVMHDIGSRIVKKVRYFVIHGMRSRAVAVGQEGQHER